MPLDDVFDPITFQLGPGDMPPSRGRTLDDRFLVVG
jgi:hypothetical protein